VSRRGSLLVAAGILLSRMFGLVRQTLLAHYLGLSDAADALNTAFRIPNFLQNLLGEGALSASFIPSYARLLGDDDEEARRLAGAVLSVLLVLVTSIVLAGELATPLLMNVLVSHQWSPEKRALTETLVRILFPGAGIMVLSAWCLGVLNSHRQFFLSYASPVVWNLAIIGSILVFGRHHPVGQSNDFVMIAAVGAVAGSILQVLVQLPAVYRAGGRILPTAWRRARELPRVVSAFLPNVLSRGANQISALVDLFIASSIPMTGVVAAISNAQVLYTLPVSLFGMAVSAAELPEMARERGDAATVAAALRIRLMGATQRLAFYIVPSALGFLTLGGVIAAAVFQTRHGAFKPVDSEFVWIVLAGSATGLLASTLGRLYASTFYALNDTRTPLRCAIVRVLLTGVLGWIAAIILPPALGIPARWGAAGLTATAGVAGWVEFMMLRRGLCQRIGHFGLEGGELLKLWFAGVVAAVAGTVIRLNGTNLHPIVLAMLAVPANAACYLAITSALDVPEAAVLTSRIRRVLTGGVATP